MYDSMKFGIWQQKAEFKVEFSANPEYNNSYGKALNDTE